MPFLSNKVCIDAYKDCSANGDKDINIADLLIGHNDPDVYNHELPNHLHEALTKDELELAILLYTTHNKHNGGANKWKKDIYSSLIKLGLAGNCKFSSATSSYYLSKIKQKLLKKVHSYYKDVLKYRCLEKNYIKENNK